MLPTSVLSKLAFAGEKPKSFCNRFGAQLFAPEH